MASTGVIPEFETLHAVSPEAYDEVLDALALAEQATRPELLAPVQRCVEGQLGNVSGDYYDSSWSELQTAVAEFTDQFVFFVSGITPEQRKPVLDALPADELNEFMKVVYTVDMGYRLRLMHQSLFGAGGDGPLEPLPPRVPVGNHTFDLTLKEIWRTATRLADVTVDDPEAVEFLRLRHAWYHNCHT